MSTDHNARPLSTDWLGIIIVLALIVLEMLAVVGAFVWSVGGLLDVPPVGQWAIGIAGTLLSLAAAYAFVRSARRRAPDYRAGRPPDPAGP